jgi:hypothetical protein
MLPVAQPAALRSALESIEKGLEEDERIGESVDVIEHGLSGRFRALRLEHQRLKDELYRLEGRLAAGEPALGELVPLLARVRRHLEAEGEAEFESVFRDVGPSD